MSVFINGIGAITPQGSSSSKDFLQKMNVFEPGRMTVTEPQYSDFILPNILRRMSKIIKMGLTSALMCLNDADIKKPDAIITATGLGSVEDTDKFLNNLIDDQESLLNPTPFIQSTHNAVAARIAIETACQEYNMTYVHKNAAFEQALLDAFLKIRSGDYKNILLGGTEEISEENYNLKNHVGFWKENVSNSELLNQKGTSGVIAGEGSIFFNLSNGKNDTSYAKILNTKTWYKLPSSFEETVGGFLASNDFKPQDIDTLLLGINGNVEEDFVYDPVIKIFKGSVISWYKHLSGEYETASSFALLLAARILKSHHIPEMIKLNNVESPKELKNILIYQQRFNRNHSFTLLSKC